MRVAALLVVAAGIARPTAAFATEPAQFTPEQARAAIEQYVHRKVSEGGGVYRMVDERSGERFELEFVHVGVVAAAEAWPIHDPHHAPAGPGYAACVRFHPVGAPAGKVLDVDLAVQSQDGALAVTGERLHKETRLEGGRWVWRERTAKAGAR